MLRHGFICLYGIFIFNFLANVDCNVSPVATLTNCGATGRVGPTQKQCNSEYGGLTEAFSILVVNGIQHVTIPFPGLFKFEAFGASGVGTTGGKGAFLSGEFPLPQGALISILVGQQGEADGSGSFGGSGGSYIVRAETKAPMLVAGGGAAGPADASLENPGTNSSDSTGDYGKGGINGFGGISGQENKGGGGAGYKSEGQFIKDARSDIIQSQPFSLPSSFSKTTSAGYGGTVTNKSITSFAGGFGGGGYAFEKSAGGGGGFSGGGGASDGATPGGGGSYSEGLNPESAVDHTGQGKVTFQFIGSGIETKCSEHSFEVSFYKELVYGAVDFYLNEASCKSTSNGTHVTISSRLDECGTVVSLTNKTVNFTNVIRAAEPATDDSIQRHKVNDIPVVCSYSANDATTLDINPEVAVLNFQPEIKEGEFLISLRAYNSNEYSYRYVKDDFPLAITTDQNLFLEIGIALTKGFEDLELMPKECFASSSANNSATDAATYEMIKNGCIIDPTLQYLPSPDDVRRRFSFKVFSFLSANLTSVFIHCEALLCNSTDLGSRCKQGCVRNKRSVDTVDALPLKQTVSRTRAPTMKYIQSKSALGSIGPFIIKSADRDDDNEDDDDINLNREQLYVIIASSVAGGLFIILIFMIIYVISIKRSSISKKRTAQETMDAKITTPY